MARMELSGAGLAPNGAANGDVYFELGLVFATGRDGSADLVEAHKWFNLAAMQGHDAAARFRQEVTRDMSRGEIAEAQRAARDWMTRH